MSRYPVHPDYRQLKLQPLLARPALPLMQALISQSYRHQPHVAGVTSQCFVIPGYRQRPLQLELFSPAGLPPGPAPCLLYLHGGGFVLGASSLHRTLMGTYAREARCHVLHVDYALAPRHPYPWALEDCLAAQAWLAGQTQALGLDPGRIGLGGDSAGGALAAGLAWILKDRQASLPGCLFLVYPVTSRRPAGAAMQLYEDTPQWNARLNRRMWRLYLPQTASPADTLPKCYASPLDMPDCRGLPPAYVEVAEFDCLRDDGLRLAGKLQAQGVPVHLHQTSRTIHGFELAWDSRHTQAIIAQRVGWLREQLGT